MKYTVCLIFLCCSAAFSLKAQQKWEHPKSDKEVLQLFKIAENYLNTDTVKAAVEIRKLDAYCAANVAQLPAYVAILKIWQAWYQFAAVNKSDSFKTAGRRYIQQALKIYQAAPSSNIVDSFSLDIKNLGYSFYDINQLDELVPIDQLWRLMVYAKYQPNHGYDFSLFIRGQDLFFKDEFKIAGNLCEYDLLYFNVDQTVKDLNYHFFQQAGKVFMLLRDYEEWRINGIDLKEGDRLYDRFYNQILEWKKVMKPLMVEGNEPTDPSFIVNRRINYHYILTRLMLNFLNTGRFIFRQSEPTVLLRKYLEDDLSKELLLLAKHQQNDYHAILNYTLVYQQVAYMYYNIGQYDRCVGQLVDGFNFINQFKHWSNVWWGGRDLNFFQQNLRYKAYKAWGKNEYADIFIDYLKRTYPHPGEKNDSNKLKWDEYTLVRCEEVLSELESNNKQKAKDLFAQLLDTVMHGTNEIYPGKNYEPFLKYTAAKICIAFQFWDFADFYVKETYEQIKPNDLFYREYFYDAILQSMISNTQNTKKFTYDLSLQTALFYSNQLLEKNFVFLTPDQKLTYFQKHIQPFFDCYTTLLVRKDLEIYPELKKNVISQLMSAKGLLQSLDEILSTIQFQTGSSSIDSSLTDFKRNMFVLNKRIQRTSGDIALRVNSNSSDNELYKSMQDEVVQLLDIIIRQSNFYKSGVSIQHQSIQQKLPSNTVVIDAIRYRNVFTDTVAYAAILLTKDTVQVVQWFKEQALLNVLTNPASSPQLSKINQVQQRGLKLGQTSKQDSTRKKVEGDALFATIIQPIEKYLKPQIQLIPDGWLNRISIAAVKAKDYFIFQKYHLKQFSSAYQLSKASDSLVIKNKKWLITGGIQYNNNACVDSLQKRTLLQPKYQWAYLPGSLKEAQLLSKQFAKHANITLKSQDALTDVDSLFSKYDIIHLATHGFYFDSAEVKEYYNQQFQSDNIALMPMLRTGLVLANANCPPETSNARWKADGYLLGYEIASLNLAQCELITLSACESALGDIQSNLGVVGLQRALKTAGVKSMLMTLWKIPDEPTVEFMQHFYGFLLQGKTKSQALKHTQVIMSKKYDVSSWGAFVLID